MGEKQDKMYPYQLDGFWGKGRMERFPMAFVESKWRDAMFGKLLKGHYDMQYKADSLTLVIILGKT